MILKISMPKHQTYHAKENGHHIQIFWVPDYTKIKEMELADHVANNAMTDSLDIIGKCIIKKDLIYLIKMAFDQEWRDY